MAFQRVVEPDAEAFARAPDDTEAPLEESFGTRLDNAEASIAVLDEAVPHVEQGAYAQLAIGNDWTAAFNAIRDHVGVGGKFRFGARVYELSDFAPARLQQMEGEGSSRSTLKKKAGATRAVDMVGQTRYPMLKGTKIDGNAGEGSRLQALNGTAGETAQGATYEDVQWWNCSICQRVAGTGAVPQAGQADKVRYRDCAMFQYSVGLQVDAINAQQQVWDGGEISEAAAGGVAVKLFGGGFIGIGMQFQQTTLGQGKIMEFAGANIETVMLLGCIAEGWLTGFDSTGANLWPLNPMIVQGGTLQVHEAAGGDLFIIDRGGAPAGLIGIGTVLNGGPIRLRGNDTWFQDNRCPRNLTGGSAAVVVASGANSRWLELYPTWHEIGAAGEPAFVNSWANFAAGFSTAAYMKDAAGVVHLKGKIAGGSPTISPAFTLPAGYRPALAGHFPAVSNGAFGQVDINAAGTVTIQVGSSTYFSLDGISFRAA